MFVCELFNYPIFFTRHRMLGLLEENLQDSPKHKPEKHLTRLTTMIFVKGIKFMLM